MRPQWRTILRDLQVRLIRYVPDDAFVARLNRVSPDELLALEFVRWVGPYQSRHKLERRLAARMAGRPPPGPADRDDVQVSIMLSPDADDAELQQVRGRFRQLNQESRNRFNTIFRGRVPVRQLDALSKSPAVLWIEPMGQMKLFDEVSSRIVAGEAAPGQTVMQQLGYDGSGVVVAVADSGLNNGDAATMHPDLAGRVDAFYYYGKLTDASDGHSHGTHVTGIVAGSGATGEKDGDGALYGLGVAPGVHIVAQRIFDDEGGFEEPSTFEELTRDAVRAGADIGSNSWGDDNQGRYDSFASEFDALVRDADATTPGDQPYIVEFSSGNAGPGAQSVGTPAVAKNVIATGASQNNRFDQIIYADGQEAMADFSSRGPAADGRIKPDLVAPGTWIASAQSASASSINAWLPISQYYQYQGGTSQAGPQVSGGAAIFVQYYRENHGGGTPSPALVKAALINSAVDMDDSSGTAPTPNNSEGWGRMDLTELIGSSRQYQFLDQTELLEVDEVYERQLVVDNTGGPLKITLTYTDVPGLPATIPALVNDLDLEVTGPNGELYRGNQFDEGESVTGGLDGDAINNVEAVHFANARPGIYKVRIRARNVAEDARVDTPEIDQDFALVISGNFLPPSASLIFFDRGFYRAPDRAVVSVLDFAAAGGGSVQASVHSNTEEAGEMLTLTETATPGLFTNSIEIVTGSPASDQRLQVSHEDVLQALYVEQPSMTVREANATIDLLPPVSTAIDVSDSFGRTQVLWETDEPAIGTVYFGTGSVLDRSAATRSFHTDHAVNLNGLEPGETYFFVVVATDRAGNVSTNDNAGARFSFVAPLAPEVLVVDAFFADFLFEPPIPIENYTDPLDDIGVSYDVWDVATRDSPSLEDLQLYRVVIWRLPVFTLSMGTFSPAELGAIRQYLEQGGSFFLADMDVLSRLEERGGEYEDFMREVLHVDSFETDVTAEFVDGVDGDPITDGMFIELDFLTDYFYFNISDHITPTGDAAPIFTDAYAGGVAGVRYPRPGISSPGRVVFLPFPFDSIPVSGSPSRSDFLFSVLKFLSPGLNGEAVLTLDRSAYTIPSRVTVELSDSDLEGAGQVTVQVTTTTEPAGQILTLEETTRIGTFRGSIALVPHTNTTMNGQLRVQENDVVRAEYLDVSVGATVTASAAVETVRPVISGVSHEPDYVDALVSWTTSENADSLVQYSESRAFLDNRTAFDAGLTTLHEVTLRGLQPDRDYYYRVVSLDAAGNVAIDDNATNLYTFRTRVALVPPWTDSLEGPPANWEVVDDDFTLSSWTLGTPNNGAATQAHSPVNAWASNIDGASLDTAGTVLISPAIDLTGASSATLRFWHNIRFADLSLDIVETAAILILTSKENLTAPDSITLVDGDTSGWEEMTVDLTPFAGRPVFIAWSYALFSFEFGPRTGWLVDDISVEVTGASGATVIITNNLNHGQWTLSGPETQSGGGLQTTLNGVPAGNYTVTFQAVPYYQLPAPQSGSVSAGGTLRLGGNYTFDDTNSNGISDAWELARLGEVSPSHPGTVDTDGDGLNDFGEFTAGTDPMDAGSKLVLAIPNVLPNGDVGLEWITVPDRLYRVLGTSDFENWTVVSDWTAATGTTTSLTLSAPGPGEPFIFQVEVRP